MGWVKKGCAVVVVLLLLTLIASAIGLWQMNRRYAVLFAAPVVDHLSLISERPAFRMAVDPGPLAPHLQNVLQDYLQQDVPFWAVDQVLPYGLSAVVFNDFDKDQVVLDVLLNERRLGPLLAETINASGILDAFETLGLPQKGALWEGPGRLRMHGAAPMDEETQEKVWYTWGDSGIGTPLEIEGDHLIEIVGDNRDGDAYLAAASLMKAHDFELNEEEQKISFPSFQFVTTLRLTADRTDADEVALRLAMEVIPEMRDRVAVVNLKVGIDELLAQLAENLSEEHQITMTGESRWEENTIVWQYTIDDFSTFIELLLDGRLFQQVSGATADPAPVRAPAQ
ncbi:MAG: hypothetical protein WD873_03615 [Candidatus Hydrogenedentales bacterium]